MKVRLLITMFMLLCTVGVAQASGESTVTVDSITYTIAGEAAQVTGFVKGVRNADIHASVTYDGKDYPVTEIGNDAFISCSGLASVAIPEGVVSIGDLAFDGCSGLTSLNIPGSVASIGYMAFDGCSGLTSLIISKGVTSIGAFAFALCSELTSLNIPGSVTSIGDFAFSSCSGLRSLVISEGVASIGDAAFWGCSGLESIYCMAETPPSIREYGYPFQDYTVPLHIPAGTKDIYRVSEGWKYFRNVIEEGAASVDSEIAESPVTYHAGMLSLPDTDTLATVYVYTQDGKCVWTCPMAAGERACDLSPLAQGIYLVRVEMGNKTTCLKIVR